MRDARCSLALGAMLVVYWLMVVKPDLQLPF
jgi:hypothetical protein